MTNTAEKNNHLNIPQINKFYCVTYDDGPFVLLIHASHEVLDGEIQPEPSPDKLEHGEDDVYVEEDWDPGPGVSRPLLRDVLHYPAPGAVTHDGQVEDASEAEQPQGDAEIDGGQLVLQAPAQTLQVLYLLRKLSLQKYHRENEIL